MNAAMKKTTTRLLALWKAYEKNRRLIYGRRKKD